MDNQLSGRWQGREVAFTDLAGFRFALETALDELGRRREEFLDRLEHLAKVTADADPVDVEAAGKCVLCVAKTTMHDDDDGVVFAGRQRAKPASNRERNLRDIDARSGAVGRCVSTAPRRRCSSDTRTSSSGTSAWTRG